jgi:hypothetical protein
LLFVACNQLHNFEREKTFLTALVSSEECNR